MLNQVKDIRNCWRRVSNVRLRSRPGSFLGTAVKERLLCRASGERRGIGAASNDIARETCVTWTLVDSPPGLLVHRPSKGMRRLEKAVLRWQVVQSPGAHEGISPSCVNMFRISRIHSVRSHLFSRKACGSPAYRKVAPSITAESWVVVAESRYILQGTTL